MSLNLKAVFGKVTKKVSQKLKKFLIFKTEKKKIYIYIYIYCFFIFSIKIKFEKLGVFNFWIF